eukprot:10155980-Prorocentrum_lima.AAC.1
MTSSLVGSEMCIRDSWPEQGFGLWPGPPLFSSGQDRVAVGQDESAVSYTHLTLPTICSV